MVCAPAHTIFALPFYKGLSRYHLRKQCIRVVVQLQKLPFPLFGRDDDLQTSVGWRGSLFDQATFHKTIQDVLLQQPNDIGVRAVEASDSCN